MSNAPAHAPEHDQTMQLMARSLAMCPNIDAAILITVGNDGRPMVGSNLDNVQQVYAILVKIIASYDLIDTVQDIKVVRGN